MGKPCRLFVTGTDTGVGKTVVSMILSYLLNASYWKPIQTGSSNRVDSDSVANFIGKEKVHPEVYRLHPPISPHLAAAAQQIEIHLEDILKCVPHGPLIVEGAGGVMVPINTIHFMSDLMLFLNIPVIVVARTTLGTINHTLLTIEHLRSRKVSLSGIIFSGEQNLEVQNTIERISQTHVLGRIPWMKSINPVSLKTASRVLRENIGEFYANSL